MEVQLLGDGKCNPGLFLRVVDLLAQFLLALFGVLHALADLVKLVLGVLHPRFSFTPVLPCCCELLRGHLPQLLRVCSLLRLLFVPLGKLRAFHQELGLLGQVPKVEKQLDVVPA